MLCQFSFQNYKSYKSETTFDFQATSIPEFSDSLLTDSKGSALLPVGVIYGPNGGGKSNLLLALSSLISTVVKPIHDLEKSRQNVIIQQRVGYEPFLFDEESRTQPTEFEIFFRQGKKRIPLLSCFAGRRSGFRGVILESDWREKNRYCFERDRSEIVLGSKINKSSINRSVNPKMPYLSFLAINYDIPMIAEVQNWFESCIIRSYANPVVDQQIMISRDEKVRKRIIQALNDMGIDMTGYRFDEDEKQLYTQRTINGKLYELRFADESDGTKKLIAALPVILLALQEGRLVIIDELDAKLHPKTFALCDFFVQKQRVEYKGSTASFYIT